MSDTPFPCLSVVMPCYNEAATIEEVVEQVLASPYMRELIIVDDGSTDGTARHRAEASTTRASGCSRSRSTRARAPRCAAASQEATADYVIVQDADLEYDPAEYGDAARAVLDGKADVVYGSRFLGGDRTGSCTSGTRSATGSSRLLSNMFTDLNLTDMETCYKAFRREVLQSIDDRGGPLRLRARDHRQGRRGRLADLRGRHLLRRPHLRRGQEDRLARRHPRLVLHRALLGGPAAPRALTTVSRIETDEGVAEVTPSTIKPRRTWPRRLKPVAARPALRRHRAADATPDAVSCVRHAAGQHRRSCVGRMDHVVGRAPTAHAPVSPLRCCRSSGPAPSPSPIPTCCCRRRCSTPCSTDSRAASSPRSTSRACF